MKSIKLTDEAEEDIDKAIAFYTQETTPSVVALFKDETKNQIERIRKNPEQFPKVYKNKVRRAVGKKFSFSTFFVDREEDTAVIAVLHQSSNPKRWKNRANKILKK